MIRIKESLHYIPQNVYERRKKVLKCRDKSGDRITFIVEGNTVRIVNSAVYAMQVLQKEMAGEAKTPD